jgi:ferredoxin
MSLLVKWLESLSQEVEITSSCVRLKSPLATCTACLDSCEREAISFYGKSVEVDSTKCNDCGQCVVSCPTSAILGIGPVRTFEGGMLVYDSSTFTPYVKELLVYSGVGLKGIVMDKVPEMLPEWIEVIVQTNERLAELNRPQLSVEQVDSSQVKLSRRKLFQSVSSKGHQFAKLAAPAAWRRNEDGWRLSRFYPDHQFFEADLDMSGCTLCQACFQLCPEQVFTLVNGSQLTIDHQRCNNCSLCIDICPSKAIRITEKISSKTITTHSITTKTCSSCHQPFLTLSNTNNKCHICNERPTDWL